MIYIGIDPGVSGGIAALNDDSVVYAAYKMPATERDLLDTIELLSRAWRADGVRAVLERVSASPQMGVVSAFTFGKGYGGLRMALTAAKIPFDEVTPQKWQAFMQCRTRGDKNVSKRRAQQLWPALTITHATADALLMAEYCRRVRIGYGKEIPHEGPAQGETRRPRHKRIWKAARARDEAGAVGGAAAAVADVARHGARPKQAP